MNNIQIVFKILGSILILLSSSMIGIYLSYNCKRRIIELEEISEVIFCLNNEICYKNSILYEAIENSIKNCTSLISDFFKEYAELMKKNKYSSKDAINISIEKYESKFAINIEDINIIKSFSNMLGKTDIEGQKRCIEATLEGLKKQQQKAEKMRAKNEKMYLSLGFLSGLTIVILLF